MAIPRSDKYSRSNRPHVLFHLPDLTSLRFPWYVEILFNPAFTFPVSMVLTSISAIGLAYTHSTRDQKKRLYGTLCVTTAIGMIATCWTFRSYVNDFKLYRQ